MKFAKKILFKNLFNKAKNNLLKQYLSVNCTTEEFSFKDNLKALCLAPHQDDETISMGGTLARFNKNFKVICLTNGARGFKDKSISKEQAELIRKKEFENAMKIAGVGNFQTLNIEDKKMFDGWDTFSKIDVSSYDYIFLPNPVDQHRDHKAVSIHLYKLLNQVKYKKNLQIMFYEVWSPLTFANKCVDISKFVDIKRKMLEAYSSQMAQRSYFEAAISLSKYRGLAKEMDFAEAYFSMSAEEFIKTIDVLYHDLIV